MKTLEVGTYVAIGAVDLAAEKVRDIPALKKLREVSLTDGFRDIEPAVRRNAELLSDRGEKVVDGLRARAEEARNAISDFRGDPRAKLDQIRTKVGERLRTSRNTRSTTAARKSKAA